MLTRAKRSSILAHLIILILVFIILVPSNQKDKSVNTTDLKISAYTQVSAFVLDDNGGADYTWAQISSQAWCSGSGTATDPYIVHDIQVDGSGNGNCILIRNSNKYFRLENCLIQNSGNTPENGGLVIYNAANGNINNNAIKNNGMGIIIINSDDMTIAQNTIESNSYDGIFLQNSNSNDITSNIIKLNTMDGIRLKDCDENILFSNTIENNGNQGIFLETSDNNQVNNNIITATANCINENNCVNNAIQNNSCNQSQPPSNNEGTGDEKPDGQDGNNQGKIPGESSFSSGPLALLYGIISFGYISALIIIMGLIIIKTKQIKRS